MSKKNFITLIFILIAVIAAAFAILLLTDSQRQYTDISRSKAMKEMPGIAITDAEFAVLRAAREDQSVQQVLAENKGKEETSVRVLPQELTSALLSSIIPEGAEVGDFAVIGQTLVIEYSAGTDHIILECLQDYRVRKTFTQYENPDANNMGEFVIYLNINNEKYEKY